jgi:hypothetical protein
MVVYIDQLTLSFSPPYFFCGDRVTLLKNHASRLVKGSGHLGGRELKSINLGEWASNDGSEDLESFYRISS